MTRAPTTLHEHFRADPRGADSFKNWIDDRIWELLQRPARLAEASGGCAFFVKYKRHPNLRTVRQCITYAVTRRQYHPNLPMRVELLDGTIIKEWAAASEATTDQASMPADRVGG